MAKPSQTFKKRQRENKLREKAQMKRERRQQRQIARKASQGVEGQDVGAWTDQDQVGAAVSGEPGTEQAEQDE